MNKEREEYEANKSVFEREKDLYGEKYILKIREDPLKEAKLFASKFNHLRLEDNEFTPELFEVLVQLYLKTGTHPNPHSPRPLGNSVLAMKYYKRIPSKEIQKKYAEGVEALLKE